MYFRKAKSTTEAKTQHHSGVKWSILFWGPTKSINYVFSARLDNESLYYDFTIIRN